MCAKTKISLIILLLLCCGISFLPAQRSKRKYLGRAPRTGAKPLEKDGEPWVVAIIQESVQIKRETLEMWDYYYVYKENVKEGYCFLGRPRDPYSDDLAMGTRLDWVSKDCLLVSGKAERTINKIYRKVIVFDNKQNKRVSIYSAPKPGATEIGKAPMYAFFYIYKEVPGYYLIGLSSHTWVEEADEDILGWIDKRSCREWNTRQAISYKSETRDMRVEEEKFRQRGMVSIYKTQEDAKNQNPEGIIDRETMQTLWYYNTPRYPLLKSVTIGQKRLFQIAFLGGKKSSSTPHLMAKLRENRQKLAQIDIMFVVDSDVTGSDQYRDLLIKSLKDAVAEFRQRAARQRGLKPDIAFGITFYNDFNKRRRYRFRRGKLFEPRVVHVYPFENNVSKFERIVKNEHRWPVAKKPERKSLYYAIDSAMHTKARWREGSQRYIFVLGKTGNHDPKVKDRRDKSGLSSRQIHEALEKNDIGLYGIHVLDSGEKSDAVACFRKQILELIPGRGGYISIYKKPTVKGDLGLSSVISLLFEHTRQEYGTIQQTLSDMEYGFSPNDAIKRHGKDWKQAWKKFGNALLLCGKTPEKRYWKIVSPDITKFTMRFLKEQGVDISELQAQGTYFEKGWVWEFHPDSNIQQIQVWLLIDKLELSRLAYFMASLHAELKKASKPEQYLEVWKTLLRTTFGIDTIPLSEPIDNLIQQHTGLPFINGLLSYSLEDFVKKSQSATFRHSVLQKLNVTCTKLFEILKEQEQEKITYADGSVILRKKKRWWQEKGSDVEYSWIQAEMFP